LPSLDAENGAKLREIPLDQIKPSDDQPRKRFDTSALADLTQSVAVQGVLQPIIVRRDQDGFRIIVGERRWRAAVAAQLETIPALIREADSEQSIVLGLIENIQREDLSCIEQGTAFKLLLEHHGITQEELAERVGKDRATISNLIRLLNLPRRVLTWIEDGELTAGHGKALLSLKTEDEQLALARQIVEKGLSVRQTEDIVRHRLEGNPHREPKAPQPAHIEVLESSLSRQLNTRVRIQYGRKRGKIVIDYFSPEELDRLIEVLQSFQ